MSRPVVLRITRPFPTVEAFLDAEAWTITKKGMLLVDQEPIDADTIVRFEIKLDNGERLMRAEGKVIEHATPRDDRPGGLKIKFKRFDGQAKELIQRAVEATETQDAGRPEMVSLPDVGDDDVLDSSPNETDSLVLDSSPTAADPPEPPDDSDGERESDPDLDPASGEQSGIHHRPDAAVAPPANRDELLARLRERAQKVVKVVDADIEPVVDDEAV